MTSRIVVIVAGADEDEVETHFEEEVSEQTIRETQRFVITGVHDPRSDCVISIYEAIADGIISQTQVREYFVMTSLISKNITFSSLCIIAGDFFEITIRIFGEFIKRIFALFGAIQKNPNLHKS